MAQRQYLDPELTLIETSRDRHLTVALPNLSLGGGWVRDDGEG